MKNLIQPLLGLNKMKFFAFLSVFVLSLSLAVAEVAIEKASGSSVTSGKQEKSEHQQLWASDDYSDKDEYDHKEDGNDHGNFDGCSDGDCLESVRRALANATFPFVYKAITSSLPCASGTINFASIIPAETAVVHVGSEAGAKTATITCGGSSATVLNPSDVCPTGHSMIETITVSGQWVTVTIPATVETIVQKETVTVTSAAQTVIQTATATTTLTSTVTATAPVQTVIQTATATTTLTSSITVTAPVRTVIQTTTETTTLTSSITVTAPVQTVIQTATETTTLTSTVTVNQPAETSVGPCAIGASDIYVSCVSTTGDVAGNAESNAYMADEFARQAAKNGCFQLAQWRADGSSPSVLYRMDTMQRGVLQAYISACQSHGIFHCSSTSAPFSEVPCPPF
ncbi:hypothetical protein INT44_002649 [Umbelopsis vinacea]|uniref:Uncharacterized protein n=1 Tax=Umbelopsis vinacea TaxID=44442 RepID=A0A8H7PET9_9FUNG|nr:hypothetical protein INT44_002649 [Umbelopsis vinacea]